MESEAEGASSSSSDELSDSLETCLKRCAAEDEKAKVEVEDVDLFVIRGVSMGVRGSREECRGILDGGKDILTFKLFKGFNEREKLSLGERDQK